MSSKTWDKLSDTQKAAVTKVSGEWGLPVFCHSALLLLMLVALVIAFPVPVTTLPELAN